MHSLQKRKHSLGKGITFCLAVWIGSLLLWASPGRAQSGKDIAVVLKTVGNVTVNRGENGTWESVKRGTRLHSGNVVRTGEKSLAALVFTDDKSLVKIRANSEVTIKGSREKKKVKKSLFMRLGELWAKVTKGNPFQVETPSGVAAVKGTEFYVAMDQSGNMVVFCMEGIIELINRLGRLDLNAGERGQLLPDNRPTKRRMREDEKPKWAAEDEINELQIEFENENGEKKILKIRFRQ